MSQPAFVITYNHLDNKPMLRVIGVANVGVKEAYPFRLYDDDSNLYFSGVSTMPFDTMCGDTAFIPLDQYGAAYGCTYMEVFENEKWSQL